MSDAPQTWDIGDPEPEGVQAVRDYTADCWDSGDPNSPDWGRTYDGEWKGSKDGSIYLSWAELVRRWGPVTAGWSA